MTGHTLVAPAMIEQLADGITAGVPDHLREGLNEYLLRGRPVGSFLEAVISGDLFDAATRADPQSGYWLTSIAMVLVRYAPEEAYGSRERYQAWIERGKAARRS